MAYTALYRKKRPQTFGELIGQPHVVRTLINQLAAGHITHAYLFSGTRGTGKTSTARLFARAVNCERPVGGEPCNTCETCLGIIAERNLSVIEIDAASNNGVDNIRELREEVKYPPAEGKYKVYIVDEAHMLTASAFNALLKTLEEPPAHVIFILATTDPQKLPATILSRCQRYDFKRLTVQDITATLSKYLKDENTEADEEALRYIASVSDGAMRDALSILDQCLSFYDGERVTLDRVLALLGAVDRRVLFEFTDALRVFNSAHILEVIDTIMRNGRDISQFTGDLVKHFRDLLVASHISAQSDILDHTAETLEQLQKQSTGLTDDVLIGYIRAFSELQNELRYTANARMALEVCAIRLCYPEYASSRTLSPSDNHASTDGMDAVLARLDKLERQLEALTVIQPVPVNATINASKNITSKTTPAIMPKTVSAAGLTPDNLNRIQCEWQTFCREVPMPLRSMLTRCTAEPAGGLLQIVCGDEASLLYIKEKQKLIQEKLAACFDLTSAPNLAFVVGDGYNNTQSAAVEEDDWASFGEQVDLNAGW